MVQRITAFIWQYNKLLSCKLWNSKQNYGQYRYKPGQHHFPASNVIVLEIMPGVSRTCKAILDVAS
jgi:hypothetical protein